MAEERQLAQLNIALPREPLPGPVRGLARAWTEAVRRTSLAVERALHRA